MTRNFEDVAETAHRATDRRMDLDWWIEQKYNGRKLTLNATGEQVTLFGCSNQGFNGIVVHYREADGSTRQAPLNAFSI